MKTATTTVAPGSVNVSATNAPKAPSGTAIIAQFLQYTPGGQVDLRKTVKVFEDFVRAQLKAQEDIKPAIIEELKHYGRLGEMTLVNFTLHALKLPSTSENVTRIRATIKDLEAEGEIVYQTSESGARKGRNAGYRLASEA